MKVGADVLAALWKLRALRFWPADPPVIALTPAPEPNDERSADRVLAALGNLAQDRLLVAGVRVRSGSAGKTESLLFCDRVVQEAGFSAPR